MHASVYGLVNKQATKSPYDAHWKFEESVRASQAAPKRYSSVLSALQTSKSNLQYFTTNLHMNSLHNHQRVVVQMEQPGLDREGGFPVKKSYTGSIRKNQLNNASEKI